MTQPDRRPLGKKIQDEFAHLQLPRGPSGLQGRDRELRQYFAGRDVYETSKALYRALCFAETRKAAEGHIDLSDASELGVPAKDYDRLREARNRPIPKAPDREPKTIVQMNITVKQLVWLRSQGPNLSETVREILDLAMGVGS